MKLNYVIEVPKSGDPNPPLLDFPKQIIEQTPTRQNSDYAVVLTCSILISNLFTCPPGQ